MIKKSPIVFDSSCVGARCAVLVLYAADRRVLGDFDVWLGIVSGVSSVVCEIRAKVSSL